MQVPRQDPDGQDRRDDRQELRRDEEEQDVAPLVHGPDRQRVGGWYRQGEDDRCRHQHHDRGVHEGVAEGEQPARAPRDLPVAVERRMEEQLRGGVRLLLPLERIEQHPEDGEEEDEPKDPCEGAERAIHPRTLPDDSRSRNTAHAASSPFSSPDRTRNEIVAMTIEKMTTTMV